MDRLLLSNVKVAITTHRIDNQTARFSSNIVVRGVRASIIHPKRNRGKCKCVMTRSSWSGSLGTGAQDPSLSLSGRFEQVDDTAVEREGHPYGDTLIAAKTFSLNLLVFREDLSGGLFTSHFDTVVSLELGDPIFPSSIEVQELEDTVGHIGRQR